jgi:CMP-N,N'-diacetyllegionaminic acid synthase
MNILVTVCGRSGSKGIKNKNLLTLEKKPLILYTLSVIELFKKKHLNDNIDVVISSDSTELHSIVESIKSIKVYHINRPEYLSSDHASKVSVISHALKDIESKQKDKYDVVIDVDITSPIRRVSDIDNVLNTFNTNKFDVVFSVTNSRRNPYFNMVVKNDLGFYERVIKSNFNTRQEAPEIYDMNASIYAYSPIFLDNSTTVFQGKCGVSLMKDTAVLDIDNLHDYELLEIITDYYKLVDSEFKKVVDYIDKLK